MLYLLICGFMVPSCGLVQHHKSQHLTAWLNRLHTTLHCSQEPESTVYRSHLQAFVAYYGPCTLHRTEHCRLHGLVGISDKLCLKPDINDKLCLEARMISVDVCSWTGKSGMRAPHQKVM